MGTYSNDGQRISAGLQAIFYGTRDANGYILGNNATIPTAGNATGSPMFRIIGGVDFNISIPEAGRVPAPGDNNSALVQFIFGADDLPSGTFTTASRDMDFEGIAQGTKVRSYGAGTLKSGIVVPSSPNFANMFIHYIRETKTYDENNVGTTKWQNVVYPNVQVQPLFNTASTRVHNPYNYSLVVNPSNQRGTGQTFTNALDGALIASMVTYESDYPYHHIRYTGDNTEDTFNLTYTPISTSEIYVFVNGVLATVASVDTTLKTFTLSAVPPNNAVIIVLYGFDSSEL